MTSLITKEKDIPEGEMWIPVYYVQRQYGNTYALSAENLVTDGKETYDVYCYYPCLTINPMLMDDRADTLLIEDGGLRLFDLRTGDITELPFSADDYTAVSLSDDAGTAEILCTNDDNSIRIFDLKTNSFRNNEEKSPR